MKGKISEVFDSIQGEGLYCGERQIFVRFFGCNLKCGFCDIKPGRFMEYEPQGLLDGIKLYQDGFHSIAFTGGEPLLQKDFLKEILKLTHAQGYKNYLETNGTLSDELKEVIEYLDIVAMDLKLPSSTGLGHFWENHRRFLKIASDKEIFLKAVICQTTKEEDLRQGLELIKEINRAAVLILQPNSYENHDGLAAKLKNFKEICLKESVTTCIIPQMHKIVGI
ncbi:MAG: 7-carboxy-7-deazaguanine synthase QueE, partial [Candidatus Omnitrophica bacterium]|nr:7-carboxy-7-deazaguanine synthase QueE [Candidatus Omnitrophota bacterium]